MSIPGPKRTIWQACDKRRTFNHTCICILSLGMFIVLLAFSRFVYTDNKSGFSRSVKGDGPYGNIEDGSYGNIVLGDCGVVSNIGGHYSPVTGQFTCQYPGVYVFSLNLYKNKDEDSTHCYIRLNGVSQVFVYATYTWGFHEVSSSVVLHLNATDTVDIGDCTPLGTRGQMDKFLRISSLS